MARSVREPPHAAKDGYTFLLGAIHHAIAPGVYAKLTYDIETDFQPIAVVAVVPQVVVVNPDRVKATTLQELIALAKNNPGMFDLWIGRERHAPM